MAFDPGGFSISTSEDSGRIVVAPRGELDLATAPEFDEVLNDSLDRSDEVVVDLRELQFMDSTGLRVLIRAHARAQGGKRFAVVRPPAGGPIAKILSVAGVDSELDFVDDL
jgi:anti-anti-sigma factor